MFVYTFAIIYIYRTLILFLPFQVT